MNTRITCLPSYEAKTECLLTSVASGMMLGGHAGGALFVSNNNDALAMAFSEEAAATRWSLVQDEEISIFDGLKILSVQHAGLTLAMLMGAFEFGIDRPEEVMVPLLLKKSGDGPEPWFTIANKKVGKCLACSTEGGLYLTTMNEEVPPSSVPVECRWVVTMMSGEFCHVTSPTSGAVLQLLHHPQGNNHRRHLSLIQRQGNSVKASIWRFTDNEDGSVVISSPDHMHYLESNSHGTVSLSAGRFGVGKRWWIRKESHTGVVICSADHHNRYLSIRNNQLVTTEASFVSSQWCLEPVHSFQFRLLCDDGGGANPTKVFQDPPIVVKTLGDGRVVLKRNEKFLKHNNHSSWLQWNPRPFFWFMKSVQDLDRARFETLTGAVLQFTRTGKLSVASQATSLDGGDQSASSRFWLAPVDTNLQVGHRRGLVPSSLKDINARLTVLSSPLALTMVTTGLRRRPLANWRVWAVEAPVAHATAPRDPPSLLSSRSSSVASNRSHRRTSRIQPWEVAASAKNPFEDAHEDADVGNDSPPDPSIMFHGIRSIESPFRPVNSKEVEGHGQVFPDRIHQDDNNIGSAGPLTLKGSFTLVQAENDIEGGGTQDHKEEFPQWEMDPSSSLFEEPFRDFFAIGDGEGPFRVGTSSVAEKSSRGNHNHV